MLAKHVLAQLSYTPARAKGPTEVGPGRLELPTSRLSGVCSKPTELWAESMSFMRTIGPACRATIAAEQKDGWKREETRRMIYKPGAEAPDRF
jgi:hypothetical protein